MLNVKLNIFYQKIKALTNFDIAFLKKGFNFFFFTIKNKNGGI